MTIRDPHRPPQEVQQPAARPKLVIVRPDPEDEAPQRTKLVSRSKFAQQMSQFADAIDLTAELYLKL